VGIWVLEVRSVQNRSEVSKISFGGPNELQKSKIKSKNVLVMFG
jgi:hypothetical protein